MDAAFYRVIEEEATNQAETAKSRISPEHAGIQINHCKKPTCVNFGIPEKEGVAKWAKGGGKRYKLSSVGIHTTINTMCAAKCNGSLGKQGCASRITCLQC